MAYLARRPYGIYSIKPSTCTSIDFARLWEKRSVSNFSTRWSQYGNDKSEYISSSSLSARVPKRSIHRNKVSKLLGLQCLHEVGPIHAVAALDGGFFLRVFVQLIDPFDVIAKMQDNRFGHDGSETVLQKWRRRKDRSYIISEESTQSKAIYGLTADIYRITLAQGQDAKDGKKIGLMYCSRPQREIRGDTIFHPLSAV